jgi:hypothetical protein
MSPVSIYCMMNKSVVQNKKDALKQLGYLPTKFGVTDCLRYFATIRCVGHR